MKKLFCIFASVILILSGVSTAIASSLSYFESNNPLILSGNTNFSLDSLDFVCGKKVDSIIIETIPPLDFGCLEYENQPVSKNEIFSRKQIEKLHVKINTTEDTYCRIRYSYFICGERFCGYIMLNSKKSKSTPSCDNINITAYSDTVYEGKLIGKSDTELTYYIAQYPKNGIVVLENTLTGVFKYYPTQGCVTDSFTYRVCNKYGDFSECKTVYIKTVNNENAISDNKISECFFAVDNGYITTVGKDLFAPSLPITKCDFLVDSMNILDYKELKNSIGTQSVFSDFNSVSVYAKGYVSYALSHEIISNEENFNPNEDITRSQACGVMQKLLNVELTPTYASFDDETELGESERNAVYSLYTVGALLPSGNSIRPNEILSRQDYAIMLERLSSLYPERFN